MDLPLNLTAVPPLDAMPAPYWLARPAVHGVPVIFASPHSGRAYPPDFVAAARLDPVALRKSEDKIGRASCRERVLWYV